MRWTGHHHCYFEDVKCDVVQQQKLPAQVDIDTMHIDNRILDRVHMRDMWPVAHTSHVLVAVSFHVEGPSWRAAQRAERALVPLGIDRWETHLTNRGTGPSSVPWNGVERNRRRPTPKRLRK